MQTLELHYPIIQFLIIRYIRCSRHVWNSTEKFHSGRATLKRPADWLLIARENSSPSSNQSQTLFESLTWYVIRTEFFCSNFRFLLSENELKTQRKKHVYSITKILTKMLHGKFSASCQYTKMRWDSIARPRKHLRRSCSIISLQCSILMELRDHGRRRTCPGLSPED